MSAVATDFDIIRMTEHDLLEVVEIEEQSGLSRWGWAAYYAELQSTNRDLMLIARVKSTQSHMAIAGYIVARETAGELHVNNVAVRAEFQRKHIGSALLERVLEKARELGATNGFLEVRSSNLAAQAMYEKCGFKAIASRQNYYSEPREDAIVMGLVLQ
ncbi:MAG: ribosomal-protein-alanine N-acetyltransferase [Blastocatellia bacterium]|nr:MAG: ribosomal-protein-alanine N-acetyltransferase [Blastocatellia bacterium]